MKKIPNSGRQKMAVQMKRERAERSEKYDYEWSKFSKEYRKVNPFCVECLKQGSYNSSHIQVDHIIPLDQRPDLKFDFSNLQSICRSHHSAKTWKEKLSDK
ncbi:HNH endonuclease [Acetobacter persici]|nr:HNH endonuclease [Acetobacter persici]